MIRAAMAAMAAFTAAGLLLAPSGAASGRAGDHPGAVGVVETERDQTVEIDRGDPVSEPPVVFGSSAVAQFTVAAHQPGDVTLSRAPASDPATLLSIRPYRDASVVVVTMTLAVTPDTRTAKQCLSSIMRRLCVDITLGESRCSAVG